MGAATEQLPAGFGAGAAGWAAAAGWTGSPACRAAGALLFEKAAPAATELTGVAGLCMRQSFLPQAQQGWLTAGETG